ncbi:MAG: hypothetical protein JWO65_131 [Sphingomonas bacterium]|nr:hypothetical protein [Sphingomonas bacterium]
MTIEWDQPATLIDLDGTTPLIATLRDCVSHFAIFKASAKADARILLGKPVARIGRRTRTWLLNPDEIEALAYRLAVEQHDS